MNDTTTSLRDQFARAALSGLLATEAALGVTNETLARTCYAVADTMLAERIPTAADLSCRRQLQDALGNTTLTPERFEAVLRLITTNHYA